MAARGSIRVRCAECRKLGLKDGYCIHLAKEVLCKHKVSFQTLFPAPDGKPIAKTCTTFDDAQKELRNIGGQIDHGHYKRIEPKRFKDIADEYLISHKGNVRPDTYTNYGYMIDALIARFGEYPINKINYKMISDFMDEYANDSLSQRQKMQCRLKGIFKLAEFQGAIKENPTRWLKGIKNTRKRKAYNGLNLTHIPELLEKIKDPTAKFYCQWAFFTGMRPSEICGIEKSCIDMDKKTIRVQQTLKYFKTLEERGNNKNTWAIYDCKSGAGFRVLPIGPELFANLQIYLINSPENGHNLLFATREGLPIHHRRNILIPHYLPAIKALNRDTDFPIMDFYDLTRHTFASMLFSMRPPIGHKRIQYLMGHEDYHTTANIYARLFGKDISQDDDFGSIAAGMEALVKDSCVKAMSKNELKTTENDE